MIVCQNKIDVAILSAVREAGATGRQSGELAAQMDIDHREISRKIQCMNKRMEQEIGVTILDGHEQKWKLIPRLRCDFDAKAK